MSSLLNTVGMDIRRSARRAATRAHVEWTILAAVILALESGRIVASHSSRIRLVIALLLITILVTLAFRSIDASLVALLAFLPFLGVARRLLISTAGWSTRDPLLIVAPMLALSIAVRLFIVEGRPLARDRISRIVLALLALTVLESINPLQGSYVAGFASLAFTAMPFVWFFIGREVVSRRTMSVIFGMTVILAIPEALYGLHQARNGLPSWDAAWLSVAGYQALIVNGSIRAFGTMASSAEYAYYLAIGIVLATAALLHRHRIAIATIPLFAWSLLFAGSRGVLVLAVATVLVLLGLRSGSARGLIATVLVGAVLAVIGVQDNATLITTQAQGSNQALLSHVADGIVHPFNAKNSTLPSKFRTTLYGIELGFKNPLGYGASTASLAGARFGARTGPGESDLPNVFTALGAGGGLLFLALVLIALRQAFSLYFRERTFVAAGACAVMVITLGVWWNGAFYAVSPLLWLTLGWMTAAYASQAPTIEATPS